MYVNVWRHTKITLRKRRCNEGIEDWTCSSMYNKDSYKLLSHSMLSDCNSALLFYNQDLSRKQAGRMKWPLQKSDSNNYIHNNSRRRKCTLWYNEGRTTDSNKREFSHNKSAPRKRSQWHSEGRIARVAFNVNNWRPSVWVTESYGTRHLLIQINKGNTSLIQGVPICISFWYPVYFSFFVIVINRLQKMLQQLLRKRSETLSPI